MAYKFSKGTRGLGDITFEDDADTGIDFGQDTISLDTGGSTRLIVTNSGIGIGTDSPEVLLHLNSTADASLSNNSSGVLMIGAHDGSNITIDNNEIMARNNTTGDILHLQAEGGSVRVHHSMNDANRVHISDTGTVSIGTSTGATDRLEVVGTGKFSTSIKTPLIEYTDGDDAITIEDGGYLKFNAGVKYTRALRVSDGLSGGTDPQWMKIAASATSGDDFDTSMSSFLVSIGGRETTTSRQIDGIFLVHVKFTAKAASPYYFSQGTWVVVEPLHADYLSSSEAEFPDFDPATDIFLTFQNDSAPDAELWITSQSKDKEVFVTHLGGTSTGESTQIDPSFVIQTGQSWQTSEPGGLGTKIYGKWASKVFSKATIKDTLTVKDMLETKAMKVNVRDVNSTSTIQASDYVLRCIQTSDITVTLPAKSTSAGRILIFKDMNGNAGSPNNHTVTLDGDSSDTIDGSATYVVDANKESVTLTCDGINGWMITSRVVP